MKPNTWSKYARFVESTGRGYRLTSTERERAASAPERAKRPAELVDREKSEKCNNWLSPQRHHHIQCLQLNSTMHYCSRKETLFACVLRPCSLIVCQTQIVQLFTEKPLFNLTE